MTKYICKCGRVVQKSTNADNTGNRDTAGCEGCPYLLPWRPMIWDEHQKAYTQDVKGQECRMSPVIEYTTTYHGRADDKCSLHIVSLDLDFLDEVQAWIYDHANETLRAGFSRGSMRGIEFSDKGRYSLSVLCAQNKKGVAAKAALLEEFFGPDKRRLDMPQKREKAHILAAIEAGKARAQKKEDKTLTYKDPATGWLYRVSPKPVNGEDVYGMEYLDPKNSTVWKPDVKWNTGAVYRDQGHLQEALEARARRDGWEPVEENVWKKNAKDAQRVGAAVTTETSAAANGVISPAIVTQTSAEKSPAPASHADAGSATQSLSAAEPASLEAESAHLAFDYSGLDDQTVADLHLAEREYAGGKKMAEMGLRRMADAVAIAHDVLCGTVVHNVDNGQFAQKEDTFRRWCESIGVGKSTAYKLLQVSKLMDNSSPREQKVLEELSPSLLYAAAKPSAPAEVVQAVKDGDITTHKQYQEALAEIRAKDAKIQELMEVSKDAARQADEARAWAKKAEQEAALDRKEREDAHEKAMHYKAECDRRAQEQQRVEGLLSTREEQLREACKERDGARDALQAAKLRGDQWQEKAEARQARIQELESRPIQTTAMDSDEVNRLVAQRMEEELARQTPRRQEEQEQAARDAYDAFILTARSLDNLWKALKPQISRLAPEQKTGAENLLLQKLMEVKEELIHACENCQS